MICVSQNATHMNCSLHEIRKESSQVAAASDPEEKAPCPPLLDVLMKEQEPENMGH